MSASLPSLHVGHDALQRLLRMLARLFSPERRSAPNTRDLDIPNLQWAAHEAKRILRENHAGKPPVRTSDLASALGYRVMHATFDGDMFGVVAFTDFDNREIVVNRDAPLDIRQFAIAHEIGHTVLHRIAFAAKPQDYRILARTEVALMHPWQDRFEQEADVFAAHLLVPPTMLRRYHAFANEGDLSDMFMVPREVLRFRLHQDQLTPAPRLLAA